MRKLRFVNSSGAGLTFEEECELSAEEYAGDTVMPKLLKELWKQQKELSEKCDCE